MKNSKDKEHIFWVYEALFYHNKKWSVDGQIIYFNGEKVHYSEFMKAKRGTL